MKTTHTKCRKKQLAPKESWDKLALYYVQHWEGRLLGTHSCTHTLILDLLPPRPFHSRTLGFEDTRQKSRDCLVSGDRETQGTESIVTLSLGRDFQQVVFWSSVVKGEPRHKGDKIIIFKLQMSLEFNHVYPIN